MCRKPTYSPTDPTEGALHLPPSSALPAPLLLLNTRPPGRTGIPATAPAAGYPRCVFGTPPYPQTDHHVTCLRVFPRTKTIILTETVNVLSPPDGAQNQQHL